MWERFRGWRRRAIEERDLDEELQVHLAIEERRLAESGQADPRGTARRTFGNLAKIREDTRDTWGWTAIEQLIEDMRFGLRILRKSPVWTTVMAATLALGIALTTAIFSVVYGVLLRPLPYPAPERLMALWTTTTNADFARGLPRINVNGPNWQEWRGQSKLFEDIALVRTVANFNVTGDGPPERLQGARTSWNLPSVLGVRPFMGRIFTEEETRRDANVALLSYAFWVRRFGRDPSILGRKIRLNGAPFEVIGVMPPEYQYPTKNFELWTPLFIPAAEMRQPFANFQYISVGRTKAGITLKQAQDEMSAIMRRITERYPQISGRGTLDVLVEPLLFSATADVRATLYILLAAVGSLLLIGCVNLGGLLIARASARSREVAVRAALGATAARLRRQMLAEVLPLSVAGAGGGILLAWILLTTLAPWLPSQMPRVETIGLNARMLAFALGLSVVIVLLAGMLPAWVAAQVHLAGTLRKDSRTVASSGKLRNGLVTAQIAVTLVLVFSCILLGRSLIALLRQDLGYSTQGVLTMHLAVTRAKHPSDLEVADYYRRLVARIRTIPGVLEAGVVNRLPLSGTAQINPAEFENRPNAETSSLDTRVATPGYFSAMGIPLIRGRIYSDEDKTPVGVIDEQLARRVFGNEDPIGKRFRFGFGTDASPWAEIVGVVGHVRHDGLDTDPRSQVYWPQTYRGQDRGALVVRTTGHPESFTSAIVEQIHNEDPDQPVYDIRSMQDWVDRNLQARNLMTTLVAVFAGASVLLACLGLYGTVSYAVGLRFREFGLRIALGAQPGKVRGLVLGYAGRLAIAGSAAGLVLVWPAGRALQSLLYGVGKYDLTALVAAPILLLAVALLAGLVPACRAARADPAITLRSE
jgi:predicted permease